MTKRLGLFGSVLGLALLMTSCATIRIGRILSDPIRFNNRPVEIEGVVTNSVNAHIAGAYQVDDGTGRIFVLAGGRPPQKGARVKVRGRVQEGVTVLGQSFGTTLRERDRRVYYGGYGSYPRY
jgi:hypothetical protein